MPPAVLNTACGAERMLGTPCAPVAAEILPADEVLLFNAATASLQVNGRVVAYVGI
jgi:hypothetical protein